MHPASLVTPQDMRRLWLSCASMFKDLMRIDHDTASINRTYARVRAFLSEIEALDAALQPARSKPLYLAKYNFPSLLRATEHLAKFGNIRDLHEGGIEGEAMVKQLRPLVPNGLKNRFATHLLNKAFRDYSLDRMVRHLGTASEHASAQHDLDENNASSADESCTPDIDDHEVDADMDEVDPAVVADSDTEVDDDDDPYEHMRNILDAPDDSPDDDHDLCSAVSSDVTAPLLFRRYSSRAIVEQYLAQGVPLSVVITNQKGNQRIGVIVAKCNEWWLLPLTIDEMLFDDPLGFTYFHVRLHAAEENRLVQTKENGQTPKYYHIQLLNYVTLLPALWLAEPFPYALLTMEGEYLNAESIFV